MNQSLNSLSRFEPSQSIEELPEECGSHNNAVQSTAYAGNININEGVYQWDESQNFWMNQLLIVHYNSNEWLLYHLSHILSFPQS